MPSRFLSPVRISRSAVSCFASGAHAHGVGINGMAAADTSAIPDPSATNSGPALCRA